VSRRAWVALALATLVAYSAGVLLPNPLRRVGFSGRVPVIRVPAVSSATFTVRWSDGVDATLTSAGLPSARFPQGWLPEGSRIGERVRLSTDILLGDADSEFRIRLESLPTP
jgi:hypothetical protein